MFMGDPGNSTIAYNETCSCNRTFTLPAALKNHQNTCAINREQLKSALDGAKHVMEARRLKRKEKIFNNLNPPTWKLRAPQGTVEREEASSIYIFSHAVA